MDPTRPTPPVPDLDALRRYLLLRYARWPADDVEDAAQEALVACWEAERRGVALDRLRFCVTVTHRRLLDLARSRRRRGGGLDPATLAYVERAPAGPARDWEAVLLDAGLLPTPAWMEVLQCIASGVRSSRRIAALLGRDVKTIRERRARLRRWLAGFAPCTKEGPTGAHDRRLRPVRRPAGSHHLPPESLNSWGGPVPRQVAVL